MSLIGRLIARRLLIAIGTLIVVSMAIFLVVEILPGDIARLMLGPYASAEDIALVRVELGLDRPLALRYLEWVGQFLTGDWGNSWRLRTAIGPLVASRLFNSSVLAGLAIITIVPIAIIAGIIAAANRGRLVDRIISVGGMCVMAVPEFVSSMFLILVFSLWLRWLPSAARIAGDTSVLSHLDALIMPIIALALVLFGYISRMVRASMIEELRRGYVRTALLKGVPPHVVLIRHVLRNAFLPTITVIANQISWLVGGLVVVENVFNYPGLGQLLLQAALSQDLPMLEITVLILAAILISANLIADMLYGVLNPRTRIPRPGAAP